MNFQETFFFLSQLSRGFDHIGAVMPTSREAARAMAAEALRQKKPKAILEVGPGTGPITTELVRHLKADDRLVLCEVDDTFVELRYLEKSIGRTGMLALQPFIHTSTRDLWQLNLLGEKRK